MKKFIYIFLILVILISAIWILSSLGVISFRAWGENIIIRTPFLKEYVQTNQAYNELMRETAETRKDYTVAVQEREILSRELRQARNTIEEQTEIIELLEVKVKALEETRYSEEERMNKLIKIYGKMAPDEIARIFSSLDDDLVIQILLNLKEDKVAEILTILPTEKAADYSRELR